MAELTGGVLCFNKPKGCTSHDIIYRVRKLYGTKQVGHTGTLDPLASGVLVVMVGRAVKASEHLSADTKEYVAEIKLGLTTDTEDITGTVTSEYGGEMPSPDEVKRVCEKFVGDIMQVPPMYSALKVDGKKLLDIARKGGEVERQARAVRVDRLEVYETDDPTVYRLLTRVSKGTYIRTLCADIGKALGTGAVMKELTRTSAGSFGIEDALTEQALSEMTVEERYGQLRPVETLFEENEGVTLSDFFAKLASCGCEIYQRKIKTNIKDGELVRLYDKNGFFALGRVTEYPDGSAIKPIKQFRI